MYISDVVGKRDILTPRGTPSQPLQKLDYFFNAILNNNLDGHVCCYIYAHVAFKVICNVYRYEVMMS